ncbi:MAG: hypothetical protein AB1505_28560 [Candidatus Latescibacterota bacterium]
MPRTRPGARPSAQGASTPGRRAWRGALLIAGALGVCRPGEAWPHQTNTSYATLVVAAGKATVSVVIDEFDLRSSLGIDPDGDGMLTHEELESSIPAVYAFVQTYLGVGMDGQRLDLQPTGGGTQLDRKGNLFASVAFAAEVARPAGEVELDLGFVPLLGAEHTALAQIVLPGQPQLRAIFVPGRTRQTFAVATVPQSYVARLLEAVRRWLQ